MPIYHIEWSGAITRDIGWVDIEAPNEEAARRQYQMDHPMRRVRSVILDDISTTSLPISASPKASGKT